MKREMRLIYLILDYVEGALTIGDIPLPEFRDYQRNEIIEYHVRLCSEAGYLNIVSDPATKLPTRIELMTWNGHEALDKLRQTFTS